MDPATSTRPRFPISKTPPASTLAAPNPWIDQLLVTAESFTPPDHLPAAQGVFNAVIELLHGVKNMKDPNKLEALCRVTLETAKILTTLKPNTAQAQELNSTCKKFQELLVQIQGKIKNPPTMKQQLQKVIGGGLNATKYEEKVTIFKNEFSQQLESGTIQSLIIQSITGGIGGIGGAVHHDGTGGAGGTGEGPQVTINALNAAFYGNSAYQETSVEERIFCGCPPPSDFFQGRAEILQKLESYFQPGPSPKQTIVLLHGLGGIGKTQIALKFISDHSDQQWATLQTSTQTWADMQKLSS
ncbi:hypothetical protein HMN09_01325800 [Mycena chlorophos]|uniref:NB-ARC domain-containing protein n=1 Tax=Mycena chlorophos TaxID=658473 RepID=A0A8H6VRT0_MYCCL|nr:hypothetical protein HMN09_01325800 [Mycena chlorophos]